MPLYLIEILHQTTTASSRVLFGTMLYLIEILHQTTTEDLKFYPFSSCILSKFYIKPQLVPAYLPSLPVVSYRNSTSNHNSMFLPDGLKNVVSYRNSTSNHNVLPDRITHGVVVSYRNSTSNHNSVARIFSIVSVVSYRNSTSNHNFFLVHYRIYFVVSYRNSTSNHNVTPFARLAFRLYLIEILHQTTTKRVGNREREELYLIEILHQTTTQTRSGDG